MANPRTKGRLEARILERAAYCLQFELRDPRAGFVTLTRAELSPDLTYAKVFYSVLGDAGDRSKVAHMLEGAAGFVQRQVARVLEMRRVPHLRFVYDETLERAQRMDELIREARRRDREINPHADDAPLAAEAGEPEPRGDLEPEPRGDLEPEPRGDLEPEPQGDLDSEPQGDLEPELEPGFEDDELDGDRPAATGSL